MKDPFYMTRDVGVATAEFSNWKAAGHDPNKKRSIFGTCRFLPPQTHACLAAQRRPARPELQRNGSRPIILRPFKP
jgi:hypothetical protein